MRRISAALTSCIVFGVSNSFAAGPPPKCEVQKKLEQLDIATNGIVASFAAHNSQLSVLISTTSGGRTTVNAFANATGTFAKAYDTDEALFTFIDGEKTYLVKNFMANNVVVKTLLAPLTKTTVPYYIDGPPATFNAVTKVGNDYIFVGKAMADNVGSFYKGNDLTKLSTFSPLRTQKGELLNVAGSNFGVVATSLNGLSVLTDKVRDVDAALSSHKGEVVALETSQLVVDSKVKAIHRSTDWFKTTAKSVFVLPNEMYSRIVGSAKTVYAVTEDAKTLVVSVDEGLTFTPIALPEVGARVVKSIAYDAAKSTLYVASSTTANKLDFHTIVCKPGAAHATAAFTAAVFLSILAALFV